MMETSLVDLKRFRGEKLLNQFPIILFWWIL